MSAQVKKINVNSKNRKTTDCVARAISFASGKPYETVIDDLVKVWKDTGYHIGDKKNYEKLLALYGFVKQENKRKYDNSKYKVREIDQLCPNKVAVITMANHLTAYVGGYLIDIWNCGYKTIGNFYTIDRQLLPTELDLINLAETI